MATEAVTELNQDAFDKFVAGEDTVLVDFWAPWCGPCRALGPTIDQIADAKPGRVAKVNIDDNQELAAKLGIASIPTVMVFKNGEVVETLVGLRPAEAYNDAMGD